MTTILITNDDGIHSNGLYALRESLNPLGRTIVVAPDRDNSAVSHSLTMSRPLNLREIAPDTYTVDGTPTDCVILALGRILNEKPDLLVSGINRGANLGDDISYSGTVSAAMEGTIYGVASMALSLAAEEPRDYTLAGRMAHDIAIKILQNPLPAGTLVNINVPGGDSHNGIRITRQGKRLWENAIQKTKDPWGRTRYWIGGGTPVKESGEDTDVKAIHDGYVSITPIHLDLTHHEGIRHLESLWLNS
ncbi:MULTISPECIES: 5'/3'-nucleotidase SurE [Desulfosediminicola]|uniref:5'/3'-nucleotidase SurE n=1 Tax=Desulfosediminicola TaxID=2886823 RepID=UPI0010AC3982|nr:5'/3'-nucleotidase SurE [Desulfosediminicola ganghwensis]